MKRYYLASYMAVLSAIFLLSGCGDVNGIVTVGTDRNLPTIRDVKVLVEKGSVGFEWPVIRSKQVKGINIYRAIPRGGTTKQKFAKIGSVSGGYATHYVDRTVQPNQKYLYTFTTYDLFHESPHGKIVKVRTSTSFAPVKFVKVYLRENGVVKVLWQPHDNPQVTGYIIQRRLARKVNDWHYLATVKGRLMPEYIDRSVARSYRYAYRVIARTADGMLSQPSQEAIILAR